jgi:hypothetical protein
MEGKKINEIEEFPKVTDDIRIYGYSPSQNKTAYINFGKIHNTEWCGCRWKDGDANPEGEPVGDLDMLRSLVDVLGLGGYLVTNDHSRKKLSASNHLYLANGQKCVLDGTQGHYQWGWGHAFYYSNWKENGYFYEAVANSPIKGRYNYYIPIGSRSAAGYAALNADGTALVSLGTATIPCVNKPVTTLQTLAHKNGDLWFASERVMQFITAALKRIIFHNRNIQANFNATLTADGLHQGGTGMGYSGPTPWDNGYLPLNALVEDGDALELGTFSGDTKINDGTAKTINVSAIPNFFGLKNDYKYLVAMSENLLINITDNYPTLYIDDSVGKKLFDLNSIANHEAFQRAPYNKEVLAYPKNFNLSHLAFWASEDGGTDSTYYCDRSYFPNLASGLRGVLFLGNAVNGSDAGSLYVNGGSGVGDAFVGWGSFLCEWAEEFDTKPVFAK